MPPKYASADFRQNSYRRHYLGDATATGQIEVFDPGHDPVVAWRLPRTPATR